MASQSTGIQQLLAAEKRAAEKVADARKSNLCITFSIPLKIYEYVFLFKLVEVSLVS